MDFTLWISQPCTFKCDSGFMGAFPRIEASQIPYFQFLSEVYTVHIIHCHTHSPFGNEVSENQTKGFRYPSAPGKRQPTKEHLIFR